MNDEELEWTKTKRNLILTMMREKFEERVYAYLDGGEYKSMEELDKWVDDELHKFENERKQLKAYYNKIMYS